MGQVDFGKIISAAAVSTLGVLSLIVVVLGGLAFYFFKGSPEKVKLTVWLTALIAGGLFAVAFISQADRADPPKPRSVSLPSPLPSPIAQGGEVDPADLTGRWHDTDGYFYDVTQTGSAFAYRQYQNGADVGSGQGTLSGRTLRYGFLAKQDGTRGACEALVAVDYRSIRGSCASGGERWPFFLER